MLQILGILPVTIIGAIALFQIINKDVKTLPTIHSEASHDWKSQASFHGLTHPCRATPIKRRFPAAVFRYLPVRASTGSFSI